MSTVAATAHPSPAAAATNAPPSAPAQPVWGLRLATGLGGVLVAAMMSGLNNRVGSLTLADMAGARGLASDDAHLVGTVYAAAELAAMPIASWFTGTFSLRRFHMAITGVFLLCAILLPLAPSFAWLLVLRAVQGLAGGAMIPLLMSAALRFLPPAIKLQGLGFYSLTATFSPNLALWLAATWTDGLGDWRLAYWQVIPIGLFVLWAIWWGIPQDPLRPERLREIDRAGLVTGPLGLALLAFALEEGERLDWLHSAVIAGSLCAGLALIATFLVSEWFHPAPFMKLQLLKRRNYGLGFPVFVGVLVVVIAGALLPAVQLAEGRGFRPAQIAPVGLIVSLPQIVLAPLVSWLLCQRWVDARHVMALGLLLIGSSCWLASGLDDGWMVREFWAVQTLQTIGQPLAIVGFLYLCVGITAPHEGPFLSGLINTLKTVASVAGGVLVERVLHIAAAAHQRGMIDRIGRLGAQSGDLPGRIEAQSLALAVGDGYRLAGLLALLLIVPTLLLTYVAPPQPPRAAKD